MNYPFEWEQIIIEAREKDLWVEPITVSRLIREFPAKNMQAIKWIKPVNETKLLKLLETVSDDIGIINQYGEFRFNDQKEGLLSCLPISRG